MSVINKMLRDLDHRANPSATAQPGPSAMRQGTASVAIDTLAGDKTTSGSGAGLWLGLGLVAVATASIGSWWWASSADTPPIRTSGTAAPPIAVVASSPAATAALASASSGDGVAEPSVASMILRMESSLSARKALDALLTTPSAIAAAPAPASVPQDRSTTPRATASKTQAATAPNPTGDSTPILQRQQQAGGEALAQAQTLWSSGSRDAAMDLMQQSIAAAERNAKAGAPGTTGGAVLLPLVREMARMQLAEARYGAVWEMLTRLEPLLGNPSDLWAIRANAAQRLGRHQDSVHAYMMALQSRPDEQRWLLGTAVSLAALGQTTSAAEMAEKARAVGPVGKDILAYLRQTGVPLREQ